MKTELEINYEVPFSRTNNTTFNSKKKKETHAHIINHLVIAFNSRHKQKCRHSNRQMNHYIALLYCKQRKRDRLVPEGKGVELFLPTPNLLGGFTYSTM